MKMILGFILVFIFLSSCSPISSKVSDKELALNPVKQEVFDEMTNFLRKLMAFDADHYSEFYSDNAFIYANRRYTPKGLEKMLIPIFKKMKWQGEVRYSFQIQSLEVVGDRVLATCQHNRFNKTGPTPKRTYLRWYVWKKIDGKWKIISFTAYPSEFISEEDRVAHGL